MTLDDLEKEFWGDQREQTTRVRLARVVRAMRGVIDQAYSEGRASKVRGDNENVQRRWVDAMINEIFAGAGEEKAAGDVNPDGARISGLETTAPAASGSPAAGFFDFEGHLAHQAMWSEATFGPGRRTAGVCDHIRKELVEVETDPEDANEWIDVVILALDGAWRAGLSPRQIIDGIVTKQRKNEGRTWPDWRTADPNKAIEHDRTKDAPAAAPVCEWTRNPVEGTYLVPCVGYETSRLHVTYLKGKRRNCPSCGLPISFKDAAR